MSYFIEWVLELWAMSWRADEQVHGPSRSRWPWIVFGAGVLLLIVVWGLEENGVLRW